MKRLLAVTLLLATLPGCGLWDRLFGKKEHAWDKDLPATPAAPAPATPLAPAELVALLPQQEGWEGPDAVGETVDVGANKATRATGTYKKQSGEVTLSAKVRIVDGANSADIYAPLARMAHTRPDDPHKMPIDLGGHSGIQDWLPDGNKVNVAVVVARRFLITLEGEYLTPQVVQQLLGGIDLQKLTASATPKAPTAASK